MKRTSLEDSIGYFVVRLFGIVVRCLPIEAGLWLGRRLGDIEYLINRKRRRIAYLNLKAAVYFDPEAFSALGFAERRAQGSGLKRIVRGAFWNIGQSFIEMLYTPKTDSALINKYVKSEGLEYVKEAQGRGKGFIVLTAHFGNWELSSHYLAINGIPVEALARQQKHTKLNELLNRYREFHGNKIIAKGMAVRELIRCLQANKAIGMLADQDSGRNGIFTTFFGRPVSTPQGPFRIASITGCVILPFFMIRLHGPHHKLVIEKPISTPQEFASLLESYVIRYPSQWLWMHKRWKSTPVKAVLVLDDGKAGHLSQSLSVVKIIKKRNYETRCKIVKGDKGSSVRDFLDIYADIVVSCGSSTARLNLALSKENNAKSIVIMKPSFIPPGKFSLAIIPKHDNPRPAPNVVETLGAPNMIDEEEMRRGIENLLRAEGLGLTAQGLKLGLLIGGDTKEYKLTKDTVNTALEEMIRISEELDGQIFVTTSRRTSKEVENLLKERLKSFDRCKLLIIANERNIDKAVPGILGLCDIIVISPESISMVSESASSGKYTMVFKDECFAMQKHLKFLENIKAEGHIYLVRPSDIYNTIKYLLQEKPSLKALNDSELIKNAIAKLL